MSQQESCSDPNCNTCAQLRKEESIRSKEKTKMLSGKFDCARCGNTVSVNDDPAYCYCGTCDKIVKQEISSLQKKIASYEKEISLLRDQVANLENSSSMALSKMKTVESAYSDEAKERLQIRVERDEARNAIMCWKSMVDHMKAKASCAQCTAGLPCQILKLLGDQVNSQTPKWDCPDCVEKLSSIAALTNVLLMYQKFVSHRQGCVTCSEFGRHFCSAGEEYMKSFTRESKKAGSPSIMVSELWQKLSKSIETLAMFGDGSSLILMNGKYYVARLNNMRLGDMKVLGSGHNPKEACEMAVKSCEQVNLATHRVASET